jgi:hypothetical protein
MSHDILFLVDRADFRKSCCIELFPKHNSSLLFVRLRRGELGDGLGSLRHSVLGELTRKHETNGSLDLAGRESGLLVVGGKLSCLAGDALEDVVDERVHDTHPLLADTGVGVDLLEDLVDVGGVGFDALLAALLLSLGGDLRGSLGRSLLGWCFSHGWKGGRC